MPEATYVELIDGQIVTRDAEEWRHETEAWHLLSIKPRSAALAELAEIERRRGKEATDRLRATMNQIVKAGKAA